MKRLFPVIAVILIAGVLLYEKKQPVKQNTGETDTFTEEVSTDFKQTSVEFAQLNGFETDPVLQALPSLQKSCEKLEKQSEKWRKFCKKFLKQEFKTDDGLRTFIQKEMQPYAVNDGKQGLFTGYYEPEIEGALTRQTGYDVPVYALPEDIISIDLGKFNPKYKGEVLFGQKKGNEILPYLTRREIETKEKDFPAEIIAWVKEPADLFILQIQGSGVLKLPDGQQIGIGYAGNNGHAFKGIGSIMKRRGLLKKGVSTMSEIKDWLIANPEQAKELMYENPRYIFFKKTASPGAVGSLGVKLTAGRSLAVDPAYIPLGSFLWLQTTAPDGTALNRLITAQDTGTAIKGAVRGDFFWGTGEKALKEAGRMKSAGTYFILLPKD